MPFFLNLFYKIEFCVVMILFFLVDFLIYIIGYNAKNGTLFCGFRFIFSLKGVYFMLVHKFLYIAHLVEYGVLQCIDD